MSPKLMFAFVGAYGAVESSSSSDPVVLQLASAAVVSSFGEGGALST